MPLPHDIKDLFCGEVISVKGFAFERDIGNEGPRRHGPQGIRNVHIIDTVLSADFTLIIMFTRSCTETVPVTFYGCRGASVRGRRQFLRKLANMSLVSVSLLCLCIAHS